MCFQNIQDVAHHSHSSHSSFKNLLAELKEHMLKFTWSGKKTLCNHSWKILSKTNYNKPKPL